MHTKTAACQENSVVAKTTGEERQTSATPNIKVQQSEVSNHAPKASKRRLCDELYYEFQRT